MTPGLARRLWRIAALTITAAMLLLLLLPARHFPSSRLAGLDELVHLVSYFLVGLSWHRSGVGARAVLLFGLIMAVGTEAAQELMGLGRRADAGDLLADVAGLVAGVGASLAAGRPRSAGEDR